MVKYKRVEESVRICLTQFGSSAVQTDESSLSGIYGNGAKFKGPLSEPLKWFNDAAFGHELMNYTSVLKKSFGKYNESSGYYDKDSCMYSMQKNETDAGLIYIKMPVLARGLVQVPPWVREYTAILSKYNVTKVIKVPDVFESFRTSFDGYIWITLALFALVFIVLVKMRIKFENKRLKQRRYEAIKRNWRNLGAQVRVPSLSVRLQNDPRLRHMLPNLHPGEPKITELTHQPILMQDNAIYDVLTHLFQVETSDYNQALLRVILLLITLLSFYVFTYFNNLMSTDMVLAEKPLLIKSYKDLLARGNLRMVYLDFQDNYREFELAPEGSIKRQLWDKSLESVNGSREKMFIKLNSEDGLYSSAVDSITKTVNVDEKNRLELVAIFSSTIVITARATACTLKAAFAYRHSKTDPQFAKIFKPVENVYSYVAKDPEERETLVAPVFREDWQVPLTKRIIRRAVNLVETGTLKYVLERTMATTAVTTHYVESPDEVDEYRKCMSNNFEENMQLSTFISMKTEQFKFLFYSCGGLLLVALVALCYEEYY